MINKDWLCSVVVKIPILLAKLEFAHFINKCGLILHKAKLNRYHRQIECKHFDFSVILTVFHYTFGVVLNYTT